MHGTGNDFVIVDGRRVEHDWPSLAVAICDRHFGVGSDGLLVLAESAAAPVRMRMYNPDGSEGEMCGNGLRCFVKYVVERGIAPPARPLLVETGAGLIEATCRSEGGRVRSVRLAMGAPRLAPADIPVRVSGPGPVRDLAVTVAGHGLSLTCVSMGNPHAVAFVDRPVSEFPLDELGPLVERHELFPNRTNFHVVRALSRHHLEMRPWERGAGATLACGSGAAAVTVAARLQGLIDGAVKIDLPGGTLETAWNGEGPVELSGPAVEVFHGTWPEA